MKKLLFIAILFMALSAQAQKVDSCVYYRWKADSLSQRVFILKSQVNWVQYYIALINRRPKDTVYTKGWLIRAISSKLPPNKYDKPVKKQASKKK